MLPLSIPSVARFTTVAVWLTLNQMTHPQWPKGPPHTHTHFMPLCHLQLQITHYIPALIIPVHSKTKILIQSKQTLSHQLHAYNVQPIKLFQCFVFHIVLIEPLSN